MQRIARAMHPTIIATFLDCAPMVFSPNGNPHEVSLQMVVAITRISNTLYGSLLIQSDQVR
jgi:pre-rRNA-processing protein IPI1